MKILSTYGKVVNGMDGHRNWGPVHIRILPYQVLLLPCHFQVAPFLCLCFFLHQLYQLFYDKINDDNF